VSNEITMQIKGANWIIRVLSSVKYEKIHGSDSYGITIILDRRIDINKRHLTPNTVRHELFHAFMSECNTESANLDTEQLEELAASIVADFAIDLIQKTDTIMEFFLR
jgi:hypothetical protein